MPDINATDASASVEVEMVTCRTCDEVIPESDTRYTYGRNYCEPCHDEEFRECDNCGDTTRRDDIIESDDDMLCGQCNRDRENQNDFDDDRIPERQYSLSDLPEFQSEEAGKFISSQRIFSAEIECYYNNSSDIHEVANDLSRAIGISHDGSLDNNGVELQTPKLRGKKGEQAILKICKALTDNGHYVNRTTGLHIHLDGQGLMPPSRTTSYPREIIGLWSFYVIFEDVFLSFLPRSRRRNRYCALVHSDFHVKEIRNCETLEALEKLWYRTANRNEIATRKSDKYDSSRYMGVNLHSLFASNHLEIRYHSGTLNPVKILEWVNVHQRILDLAAGYQNPENYQDILEASKTASYEPTLEGKTEMFFDILSLDESSRTYFKSRQAMFGERHEDKGEEAVSEDLKSPIENAVCAA
jgi:hypothetical protein